MTLDCGNPLSLWCPSRAGSVCERNECDGATRESKIKCCFVNARVQREECDAAPSSLGNTCTPTRQLLYDAALSCCQEYGIFLDNIIICYLFLIKIFYGILEQGLFHIRIQERCENQRLENFDLGKYSVKSTLHGPRNRQFLVNKLWLIFRL